MTDAEAEVAIKALADAEAEVAIKALAEYATEILPDFAVIMVAMCQTPGPIAGTTYTATNIVHRRDMLRVLAQASEPSETCNYFVVGLNPDDPQKGSQK